MSRKKSSRRNAQSNQNPEPEPEPEAVAPESTEANEAEPEPEAVEEPEAPEAVDLPSKEELMSMGYTEVTANRIIAAIQDQLDGAPGKLSSAYKIATPHPNGFWAIGKQFSREPTYLWADEVTDDQIRELEAQPPQHLTVELVDRPDPR